MPVIGYVFFGITLIEAKVKVMFTTANYCFFASVSGCLCNSCVAGGSCADHLEFILKYFCRKITMH